MSDISDSIIIVPGGVEPDNKNAEIIEVKFNYKDYKISIFHSADFKDDITKDFSIEIEFNFDIYKKNININDIRNSSSNTKFIKTIEINPDLILSNLNNNNFTILNRNNYLVFNITIAEFKQEISFSIPKDNILDEKDIKIKKLENRIEILENKFFKKNNICINNLLNIFHIAFNDKYFITNYLIQIKENIGININYNYINDEFKKYFELTKKELNYTGQNNTNVQVLLCININFCYDKYKLLHNNKPINIDESIHLDNSSSTKAWCFDYLYKKINNDYNDFRNSGNILINRNNINSYTPSVCEAYSRLLFILEKSLFNIYFFNVIINYLLEKNILLTNILIDYNNYKNFKLILNNEKDNIISNIISLNLFEKLEFEYLPKNHNIKGVYFEIINPDDKTDKNYIFKYNLYNILEYGIYIEK